MKDKKIFAIIAALAALALIIVLAFIIFPAKKNVPSPVATTAYQPDFLNAEEKQALGLPAETKVQVFDGRDGAMVYKIIRSDSEIVTDPSQVGPISPRQR
jgi:hypothetical protein